MRDFVPLDPAGPLQTAGPLAWVFWDAESDAGGRAGLVCLLRTRPGERAIDLGLVPVDATWDDFARDPATDEVVLRGVMGESRRTPAWLTVRLDDGALVLPVGAPAMTRLLGERLESLLSGPVLDRLHRAAAPEREAGFHEAFAWDSYRSGWQVFWSDVQVDVRPDLYTLPDGTRVRADLGLCPDPGCPCTRFLVRFTDAPGGWFGDAVASYVEGPVQLVAAEGQGARLRAAWDAFARRWSEAATFAERARALQAWAGPRLPARARTRPGRNAPCPCGSGETAERCCESAAEVAGARWPA